MVRADDHQYEAAPSYDMHAKHLVPDDYARHPTLMSPVQTHRRSSHSNDLTSGQLHNASATGGRRSLPHWQYPTTPSPSSLQPGNTNGKLRRASKNFAGTYQPSGIYDHSPRSGGCWPNHRPSIEGRDQQDNNTPTRDSDDDSVELDGTEQEAVNGKANSHMHAELEQAPDEW